MLGRGAPLTTELLLDPRRQRLGCWSRVPIRRCNGNQIIGGSLASCVCPVVGYSLRMRRNRLVLEKMVRPLRANGSSFRVTGDVTAPIYSSNRRCKACNRSGMAGWGSEKLKHRKQGWQQVGLGLKCVST